MHVETDLLNSVGEIRPGEGEILQGTSQTPVGSRISHRIPQISRQLLLSVDRSGDDALKQLLTGGCEHNVINIEQQIGSLIPTAVDEERRVRLGLGEPQCQQECGEPSTKSDEPASVHRETC